MIGRVVSTKMIKTAVILVTSTKRHPLYKKSFTRNKKYLCVDELNVKDGDIVEVIKIRPVSKNKHWKIIKIVGKDMEKIIEAELKEEAAEIIEEIMPVSPEPSSSETSESEEEKVVADNSTKKPAKKIKKGKE